MKRIMIMILAGGLLASCGNKDNETYSVPSTYQFTDKNGNNTVSYSGQTARADQLSEITTYMKTANTPGTALSEAQLLEMYSNNNGAGSLFFSEAARTAGKQLREKTARGETLLIGKYETRFKNMAAASAATTTGVYDAQMGKAGVLQSGTSAYLVDELGAEFTQLIEKGLMGAVFYDQIQNVYLGPEKMALDNTMPMDAMNGQHYTAMEHSWDEAYGYFSSSTDFPNTGTDRFWGKYSNTVDPVLGTNAKISEAFRAGRAAISNMDYTSRDHQISIICTELERVAAGTAIHYLNQAINNFTDDAIRCHVLSEVAAFMEAMYFTNPNHAVVSGTALEELISILKDGTGNYDFYNLTLNDIAGLKDGLAAAIGMTDVKEQL